MTEVQCYNKGCGLKFDSECNKEDACRFHPGGPIFHDALKGWSCCKKRTTDFSEFLSIPGCKTGSHTNEKPPQPEAAPPKPIDDIIPDSTPQVIKPADPTARPSSEEPMQRLACTVGATLKQALAKQMQTMSLQDSAAMSNGAAEEIKPGESCKNNACQKSYQSAESNLETCLHHPGCPIFHEGMKYWSCCQRKTSEFDNFLAQEGCTEARHLWVKKETGEKVACRFDWHQTATLVTISVFAKVAIPEKSWVEVNQVKIAAHITFDKGNSVFTQEWDLKGVIDPSRSSVKLLGTKVEINMRKGEPGSWATLELPKAVEKVAEDSESEPDEFD